ncbi:MAG: F0F1 ATP synthase subunit delta, partial [Lewinella sp.]
MQINWFTVIAQAVNFLLLVWLLKKFLYRPILEAVDARENKIADELKEAAAEKATAQQEQEALKKRNEDFDLQKKGLLDTAVAEVAAEKATLIDSATTAAKALRAKLHKAGEAERSTRDKQVAEGAQRQVFALARRALTDIASVSLEEQATNTFISHLLAVPADQKDKLLSALTDDGSSIVVKSAFELAPAQRTKLTDAVNELLGAQATLQFRVVPEVISGIELSTDGFKVAWSFSEYLSALD